MIRGFCLALAKTVSAGNQRQGDYRQGIVLRQQMRVHHEQAGNDNVVGIIDDILEPVTVKPGILFLYPDGSAKVPSLASMTTASHMSPKRLPKVVLFNPKNAGKGYESAASGIGVDQPGKESAPGHSTDYVADATKLGLSLEACYPCDGIRVPGSTGNLKSLQEIKLAINAISARLKVPARYSLPCNSFSILSKHWLISAVAAAKVLASRSASGLRIS